MRPPLYREWDLNPHGHYCPTDFKSVLSTDSNITAYNSFHRKSDAKVHIFFGITNRLHKKSPTLCKSRTFVIGIIVDEYSYNRVRL